MEQKKKQAEFEEKALMMQQMKELAVAVIKGKEISNVPASE